MRNIFRIKPRFSKRDNTEDGYGWLVDTQESRAPNHGDASTLPMNTWTADPVEDRGLFEELTPTTQIPKIIPDGPEASFTALSFNDVDATCTAAHTLRSLRSIEVVLAGLFEYVNRHPVAV